LYRIVSSPVSELAPGVMAAVPLEATAPVAEALPQAAATPNRVSTGLLWVMIVVSIVLAFAVLTFIGLGVYAWLRQRSSRDGS
jgi:hypothetical protein